MTYGKLMLSYPEFAPTEVFLIYLAVGLLLGGIIFILVVFFARLCKSARERKSHAYQNRFRNILNDLVVSESLSNAHNPQSAIEYKLAELNRLQQTKLSRQILLDQVIDMKRNLSGSSVKTLKMLYIRLELYSSSLRKLDSMSCYSKARGIRELGTMGYTTARQEVSAHLTSRNRTLREEAILATLELTTDDPLAFLTDHKYGITDWMRIQLHRYLQKLDPRTLPDFSTWFNHNNITVVLFAVSMVKAFRQTSSISGVISLLRHSDERVVSLGVEAIAALEAFEFADTVANLTERHFRNENISRRIAHCLGVIGTLEGHCPVLLQFTGHPDFEVRFSALKSLTMLGATPDVILTECGPRRDEIELVLRHLSEPLLN